MKRRSFLSILALSGVVSVFNPTAGASEEKGGWNSFGYDPQNTSYKATSNIGEDVETEWKHMTGNKVLSSPSVVDSTVYVGSWEGSVYALDHRAGDTEWEFETEKEVPEPHTSYSGRVGSSPDVADGKVIFGSWDGHVYAVSAESGDEVWRFETPSIVRSSPVVESGKVYVGDWTGKMNALSPEDGTKEWSYDTGRDHIYSTPCFDDDTLYFGAMDSDGMGGPEGGGLYALDKETGEEVWEFGTRKGVGSSPSLWEGNLYFGSFDGYVHAVEAESGEEVWSYKTDGEVASSPAVDGKRVYIGSWDNNLYALGLETGEMEWSYETGDRLYATNVTATDDAVYFGSHDGHMYAARPEDGEPLWEFETDGKVRSGASVADGRLYFGSWDGNVYALSSSEREEVDTETLQYDERNWVVHEPFVERLRAFLGL